MIATGDEVGMPGRPIPEGKVHASNLVTLNAWCRRFGMAVATEQVPDDPELLEGRIAHAEESADALVTSGGAWTGDRDLVAAVLEQLGRTRCSHRIRIGPGKAVGFGLLKGKPVFAPLELDSRLRSLAMARAVVAVPEGVEVPEKGVVSRAWDLS